MVPLSAEFAYFVLAFANNYSLGKLIQKYSFITIFAAAKNGPATFLRIP